MLSQRTTENLQVRLTDLNKDLYICPITLLPIRHPILASDGYHYELKAFLKCLQTGNKMSPMTRDPITSVIYDLHLKEMFDQLLIEQPDRYENYENVKELLKDINRILAKTSYNFIDDYNDLLKRDLKIFTAFFSFSFCLSVSRNMDPLTSLALCTLPLLGALSYSRADPYRIADTVRTAITETGYSLFHVITNRQDDDRRPNERRPQM